MKYDDAKAVLYDGEDSCNVEFHNKMRKMIIATILMTKKATINGSGNSGDNSQDVRNIEKEQLRSSQVPQSGAGTLTR